MKAARYDVKLTRLINHDLHWLVITKSTRGNKVMEECNRACDIPVELNIEHRTPNDEGWSQRSVPELFFLGFPRQNVQIELGTPLVRASFIIRYSMLLVRYSLFHRSDHNASKNNPGHERPENRLTLIHLQHYERYNRQSLDIGIDPYLKISLVEIQ